MKTPYEQLKTKLTPKPKRVPGPNPENLFEGLTAWKLLTEGHNIMVSRRMREGETDLMKSALVRQLQHLFPADEMAVLQKYGYALPINKIGVMFNDEGAVGPGLTYAVDLPATVIVPTMVSLEFDFPNSKYPVPPETESYFYKIMMAHQARQHDSLRLSKYPTSGKGVPTWKEVYADFPAIALAVQQKGDKA